MTVRTDCLTLSKEQEWGGLQGRGTLAEGRLYASLAASGSADIVGLHMAGSEAGGAGTRAAGSGLGGHSGHGGRYAGGLRLG